MSIAEPKTPSKRKTKSASKPSVCPDPLGHIEQAVGRRLAVPRPPDPSLPAPSALPPAPELIAIDLVDANPWQAREDFDGVQLTELADDIRRNGLLQPPTVRPIVGGRYQLACGERRLRACRDVLGWSTIPCTVRALTDAELRRVAYAENAEREDLTPIEEARELEAMLQCGDARGPTELARQLGMSQGAVSNKLRLLKLPAAAQAAIDAGAMTTANGRDLATWVERCPEQIEAIYETLVDEECLDSPPEQFRRELHDAVRRQSRSMDSGDNAAEGRYRRAPKRLTPAQREALQIVEVPHRWQNGAVEERALNVALWDELAEAQYQREAAAAERREAKTAGTAAGGDGRPSAEDEERARQQAEQQARRLWEWYADWLRVLVARECRTTDHWPRLLLWLAAGGALQVGFSGPLAEAIRSTGAKPAGHGVSALWGSLAALDPVDVEPAIRHFLAQMFVEDEDQPSSHIAHRDVVAIAHAIGVDCEEAWLTEQAGPLSQRYWELHTMEQLDRLAGELKAPEVLEKSKKADKVKAFLARIPAEDDLLLGLPMPKELRKIKEPRR